MGALRVNSSLTDLRYDTNAAEMLTFISLSGNILGDKNVAGLVRVLATHPGLTVLE